MCLRPFTIIYNCFSKVWGFFTIEESVQVSNQTKTKYSALSREVHVAIRACFTFLFSTVVKATYILHNIVTCSYHFIQSCLSTCTLKIKKIGDIKIIELLPLVKNVILLLHRRHQNRLKNDRKKSKYKLRVVQFTGALPCYSPHETFL